MVVNDNFSRVEVDPNTDGRGGNATCRSLRNFQYSGLSIMSLHVAAMCER